MSKKTTKKRLNRKNDEKDEDLKKPFYYTYRIYNYDIIKSILLLRKSVYSYQYMNNWGKFNATSLTEKEGFYIHLNVEDITDADYTHAKNFAEILK